MKSTLIKQKLNFHQMLYMLNTFTIYTLEAHTDMRNIPPDS